jgi:hypothetical protein
MDGRLLALGAVAASALLASGGRGSPLKSIVSSPVYETPSWVEVRSDRTFEWRLGNGDLYRVERNPTASPFTKDAWSVFFFEKGERLGHSLPGGHFHHWHARSTAEKHHRQRMDHLHVHAKGGSPLRSIVSNPSPPVSKFSIVRRFGQSVGVEGDFFIPSESIVQQPESGRLRVRGDQDVYFEHHVTRPMLKSWRDAESRGIHANLVDLRENPPSLRFLWLSKRYVLDTGGFRFRAWLSTEDQPGVRGDSVRWFATYDRYGAMAATTDPKNYPY